MLLITFRSPFGVRPLHLRRVQAGFFGEKMLAIKKNIKYAWKKQRLSARDKRNNVRENFRKIQPVNAKLMLVKQFEECAHEKVPMSMKKPQ